MLQVIDYAHNPPTKLALQRLGAGLWQAYGIEEFLLLWGQCGQAGSRLTRNTQSPAVCW